MRGLRKADRPKVDPFSMHDAETLIATIHRDWGEAQGNYDEFRFFTGLRPSEQITLVMTDLDLVNGIVSVNKARVYGVNRSKTKTGEDRRVQLCPHTLSVLKRQLLLRTRLKDAGKIDHDHVFFLETGSECDPRARCPASALTCIPGVFANPLSYQRKTAEKPTRNCMAGVAGLFGPAGLTPSGPSAAR